MGRIYDMAVGSLGSDGLLHALCCAALTALCGLALPPLWAGVAVGALGVAKEACWDWLLGKGTPEWKDLLGDAVGIAVGLLGLLCGAWRSGGLQAPAGLG